MLIECLEKNSDETFLLQTEQDQRREGELEGFASHIPMGTRTVPLSPEQRLHADHNAKDGKFN